MTQPPETPPGSPQPPPAEGPRRRAHRAEPSRTSVVIPVAFALAVVVAGFLVVWAWLASSGEDERPVAGTPTQSATPEPTTASPTASPTPSETPTKTTTASPEPSKTKTKSPKPEPIPQLPVSVFNQTPVRGLASQFASRLIAGGWNVGTVANWRGSVPSTTVYYWPGDKDKAKRLSKEFPEVGRVWPASSPMPSRGLTVILASDFPT